MSITDLILSLDPSTATFSRISLSGVKLLANFYSEDSWQVLIKKLTAVNFRVWPSNNKVKVSSKSSLLKIELFEVSSSDSSFSTYSF